MKRYNVAPPLINKRNKRFDADAVKLKRRTFRRFRERSSNAPKINFNFRRLRGGFANFTISAVFLNCRQILSVCYTKLFRKNQAGVAIFFQKTSKFSPRFQPAPPRQALNPTKSHQSPKSTTSIAPNLRVEPIGVIRRNEIERNRDDLRRFVRMPPRNLRRDAFEKFRSSFRQKERLRRPFDRAAPTVNARNFPDNLRASRPFFIDEKRRDRLRFRRVRERYLHLNKNFV